MGNYLGKNLNDLELDNGRHKTLAEKGWARRAVVVRGLGPCGAAEELTSDLEELPAAWARGVLRRKEPWLAKRELSYLAIRGYVK